MSEQPEAKLFTNLENLVNWATVLGAVLHTDADSLVDAGNASKIYIRAAFSKHPVYKSIKRFRFEKPRRLGGGK